jgi:hypothetical protein
MFFSKITLTWSALAVDKLLVSPQAITCSAWRSLNTTDSEQQTNLTERRWNGDGAETRRVVRINSNAFIWWSRSASARHTKNIQRAANNSRNSHRLSPWRCIRYHCVGRKSFCHDPGNEPGLVKTRIYFFFPIVNEPNSVREESHHSKMKSCRPEMIEGVWEQGAEDDIWNCEGGSEGRVEKII